MNKPLIKRYFLIGIFYLLLQIHVTYGQSQKFNIDDYNKNKELTPPTDKNLENDHWDSEVYRNSKYHFQLQFPKGWEYDRGTSSKTLARALNRKKGISISVTVVHLTYNPEDPNDISKSNTLENIQSKFIDELLALNNTTRENIQIQNGFLNNYPAYIYEFTSQQSSGNQSYQFYFKQVQCFFNSKIYQLNFSIPIELYDSEMETIFNRVIHSFKFDFTYKR
ncbi:MAG: PsbP-related protein [Bacteroidota bacterium]|jgi:hypothetical protein